MSVEATVDTGFDGYLTLPPALVKRLGMRFHSVTGAELADGSTVALSKFHAQVMWHGSPRPILVLQAQGGVLLGMAMPRACQLTIEVRPGGDVLASRLE